MRYLGVGWHVRLFLEKIGVSESRAFLTEIRINNFAHWLFRHPLTTLVITIPPEQIDNKWHRMTASLDDVKFNSMHGRWRKCFTFMVKAKAEKDE